MLIEVKTQIVTTGKQTFTNFTNLFVCFKLSLSV